MNIKLKYPICIKEEGKRDKVIKSLTLGRLKAKHFKVLPEAMFDGGEGKELKPKDCLPIIGALASISEEVVDELDLEDVTNIATEMAAFMGKSQKTGDS